MIGLVGFAVGYVVGARAGREGLARMIEAGRTILASEEFRSVVDTGKMMLSSAVEQGVGAVSHDGHRAEHQPGPRAA